MKTSFFLLSFFLFTQFTCKTGGQTVEYFPPQTSIELVGRWVDTKTYSWTEITGGVSTQKTYQGNTVNLYADGTFDVDNYLVDIDYMERGTWVYDNEANEVIFTEEVPEDPVALVIYNSLTLMYVWRNIQLNSENQMEVSSYYNQIYNDGSLPNFEKNTVRVFSKE